ncbi:type II toxin-antitoxin system HipA family toxin [Agrobacterium salinitolerans]|nr:type II toxin-antitoxin system HipA family toxin [Agrobacterium salinitolerans]
MTETLGVYLRSGHDETRVGSLVRDRSGMVRFTTDASYIELGEDRPVLSSSMLFIGDEERTVRQLTNGRFTQPGRDLPPWFGNLLPEGALRDMVSRGLPSGRTTDFDILRYLGDDLPGGVVVRSEDGIELDGMVTPSAEVATDSGTIKFSLAGVQLKMSMLKQDERLTFPATGTDGDIIAKLPSSRYAFLPEIEYTCMRLAEAAGVSIPRCELVPAAAVNGIKAEALVGGEYVLAVTRFDRTADGGRVHIEDFCQVMEVPKERKYTAANEETVMNITRRLGGGTKGFLEIARRLAVNVLMGNGDAHLKNHSLIYSDPRIGTLSPAYDLVATFLYDGSDDLALKFRNTNNGAIVGMARFERAAELCGISAQVVRKGVAHTVEQAADTWRGLLGDLPMPKEHAAKLLERAQRLQLTADVGVSFLQEDT